MSETPTSSAEKSAFCLETGTHPKKTKHPSLSQKSRQHQPCLPKMTECPLRDRTRSEWCWWAFISLSLFNSTLDVLLDQCLMQNCKEVTAYRQRLKKKKKKKRSAHSPFCIIHLTLMFVYNTLYSFVIVMYEYNFFLTLNISSYKSL